MKKLLTIILFLCMVMSFSACTEQQDPKQAFAELQSNIKNENAYVTATSVYKDAETGEIFLTANVKNNSKNWTNKVSIAFAAYDINGEPIVIKSASGDTEDSYIKEIEGYIPILPGQEWLGNSEDEVKGLKVNSEQTNIAYVEAFVVSYSSLDGEDWSNPHYDEWKKFFEGEHLEDWMRTDNSTTPENNNDDNADNGNVSQEDVNAEDFAIPLGDTGATIVIPADMGFEAQESEINDFYGLGANQEWAIIANVEPKSDYPDSTIADYTSASAQANEATVGQDSDGNYYFTYVKDMGDGDIYKYYTAVRENETNYICVAFYCFNDAWDTYGSQFSDWSTTIEFK